MSILTELIESKFMHDDNEPDLFQSHDFADAYNNPSDLRTTGTQHENPSITDAVNSNLRNVGYGNHIDESPSATNQSMFTTSRSTGTDVQTRDIGTQQKPVNNLATSAASTLNSASSGLGSSFMGGMGFGLASSAISGATGLLGKVVDQSNWQSRFDTMSSSLNDVGIKPGYAMLGTGGRLANTLSPSQSVSGRAVNTSDTPGGSTSPSQGMFSQALGIGSL